MKKYSKLIRNSLIILVIALFGMWMGGFFTPKKNTEVEVGVVTKRTLLAKVTESGTIQPKTELPIAPDVSGEIIDLLVKEGDYVKKGQLLFVIKPDNYQSALEQATASVNTSKADYANALSGISQQIVSLVQDSVEFERNKALYEKKVITLVEFEAFKLKYNLSKARLEASRQSASAAKYRIESAQATLKQAGENLSKTSVFASMEGVITKLSVNKGQRVVGTGQMQGTEVLKIADLRKLEVKVEINENDIVSLELGDTATIEVDAFPKRKFNGKVTDIAYSSTTTSVGTQDQVTNYSVKILIDAESYKDLVDHNKPFESRFRPGMSAMVSIYTEISENALSVPIQAVTIYKKPEQLATDPLQEIVYLHDGDKVLMKKVETGITDDEFIQIKSGLTEGQKIVTGPYTTINKILKDSMKVIIKEPKVEKK